MALKIIDRKPTIKLDDPSCVKLMDDFNATIRLKDVDLFYPSRPDV